MNCTRNYTDEHNYKGKKNSWKAQVIVENLGEHEKYIFVFEYLVLPSYILSS